MQDKRVLLTRSDVRLAGPGILMFAIACALRTRGWHVEIAVGSDAMTQRFTDEGFAVHTVPGLDLGDRSPLRMIKGAAMVRRIVAQSDIRIVHSFNAQAGLVAWVATLGLNIAGQGVKIVNTVQGRGKEGLLKWMPYKFMAVSNYMRQDLIKHGVPQDRITTVHNSVITEAQALKDEAAFDAVWHERNDTDEFRIAGIAMMSGDKGHRASIEVFARFVERDPDCRASLTLVGDGILRPALEAFAKERGVASQVHFTGALDNVFPVLDHAHVFLHLSPQETFGIVLAEAHARGLAAITYAIGGIPEVVADGQSGILCAFDDLGGVVDALEKLAQDREQCVAMGRAGLERVQRLFMRDVLGERLEDVYASL